MKDYHFVLEGEKVIGFNLNRKEAEKLFYHIDKGNGHRSSDGRASGMIQIKCKNEQEFKNYLAMRDTYFSTKNKDWQRIAIEQYQYLNSLYESMKTLNNDGELTQLILTTSKQIVKLEQEQGLHFTSTKEFNS